MKVVILAGGMGTRISEESQRKPKPMIEIGGRPILWHIMNWYASFGIQEFIICCGYKGYVIKDYFLHYYLRQGDGYFDLSKEENRQDEKCVKREKWKVTLVNTGLYTKTAGRILKVRQYIGNEPFMLTYGDGVSNVDIRKLWEYHKSGNRIATITTSQPEGRFGAVQMTEVGEVCGFKEKAREDSSWVNIGFMVMEPEVFSYLGDGNEMLENTPFEELAACNQMNAYRHSGFWSPMDTMRDKEYLEKLWKSGHAPWDIG